MAGLGLDGERGGSFPPSLPRCSPKAGFRAGLPGRWHKDPCLTAKDPSARFRACFHEKKSGDTMWKRDLSRSWAGAWSVAMAGAVLALMMGTVGCGPVMYVHEVVIKARSSVAAAKTYEAAKYAPYEYYGAEAYLKEAEVRAGYADFLVSIKYGEKATKMAKKAIRIAREKIKAREDLGDPASRSESRSSGGATGASGKLGVTPVAVVESRKPAGSGNDDAKPTKVVMPGDSDSETPK